MYAVSIINVMINLGNELVILCFVEWLFLLSTYCFFLSNIDRQLLIRLYANATAPCFTNVATHARGFLLRYRLLGVTNSTYYPVTRN